MKSMELFNIDTSYGKPYCRICGKRLKKDELCISGCIHQRSVFMHIYHFNKDIIDKAIVEDL